MTTPTTNRKVGRPKSAYIEVIVKLRVTPAEHIIITKNTTPRQRTKILLEHIYQNQEPPSK